MLRMISFSLVMRCRKSTADRSGSSGDAGRAGSARLLARAAADGCGIRPREDAANSALALFFVARAIDAAPGLRFAGLQAYNGAMQHLEHFADRKARDVLAGTDIEGLVATGVIVSNRVVRYLAEQYARQTEGRRPFKIFNVESEAIEWANEQLRVRRTE